jgi:hypothetical protein
MQAELGPPTHLLLAESNAYPSGQLDAGVKVAGISHVLLAALYVYPLAQGERLAASHFPRKGLKLLPAGQVDELVVAGADTLQRLELLLYA